MKVKDLIKKLQEFDPELPVCVDDWSESYAHPNEGEAEIIQEVECHYMPKGGFYETDLIKGKIVCIAEG